MAKFQKDIFCWQRNGNWEYWPGVEEKPPKRYSYKRFQHLLALWMDQTGGIPDMSIVLAHPAYKEIMEMGDKTIHFIFKAIKSNCPGWREAFFASKGENPVTERIKHKVLLIDQTWKQWAGSPPACNCSSCMDQRMRM